MTDAIRLFRAMTADVDGLPRVDESARTLGARPALDVPGDAWDDVEPGTGGMSASAGDAMALPEHRRPASHGGTGRDPIFAIPVPNLGAALRWRDDPDGPLGHGFLEPVRRMPFKEYQDALWATRSHWQRVQS